MSWKNLPLALLAGLLALAPAWADGPKKVLLVGQGPDGHPAGTHEYVAGIKVVQKCLTRADGLELLVSRGDEPWKEGPELLERADGVVLYLSEGAKWMNRDPARRRALERLAKRGGGIVGLHWAIGTRKAENIDLCLKLLGGCHGGPDRKYKVLTTPVRVTPDHPITRGLKGFNARDEFYYRLKWVTPKEGVTPLWQVTIEGKPETVAWAWERPDGGRSFGLSGLHFHDNWARPEYRRFVVQGILWTLKKPIPEKGFPVEIDDKDLKLK
jgi:type 1 glutamine amidotransferase